MSTYLVTGCSRGLGLAYVRYLLSRPASEVAHVYATARNQTAELKELVQASPDTATFVPLDVTSVDAIEAAVQTIQKDLNSKGLDVLINNAGVCSYDKDPIETMDNLEDLFQINVLAIHNVTRAFLPLLRAGREKKIVNMSTTFGSMALAETVAFAPTPAYKITKAALSMLTVQYALRLKADGLTVVALSPGWVKTTLGGGDSAHLTVSEAAEAVYARIQNLTMAETGQHVCVKVPGWEEVNGQALYNGQQLPW